uniref:Uncharacterized protein n=1 Tax=Timema genevievae TaxID=629358 RepID=A0A7R9PS42_TIMGE|nr:unnamed protein product [Timema genevievae]
MARTSSMIVFLFIAVCLVALSCGYPRKHPHHQGKERHLGLETYDEYYPGQEEDELPNTAVVASMAKSHGPSNAKGLGSRPWMWSYLSLKQCPQGYKRDGYGVCRKVWYYRCNAGYSRGRGTTAPRHFLEVGESSERVVREFFLVSFRSQASPLLWTIQKLRLSEQLRFEQDLVNNLTQRKSEYPVKFLEEQQSSSLPNICQYQYSNNTGATMTWNLLVVLLVFSMTSSGEGAAIFEPRRLTSEASVPAQTAHKVAEFPVQAAHEAADSSTQAAHEDPVKPGAAGGGSTPLAIQPLNIIVVPSFSLACPEGQKLDMFKNCRKVWG